MELKVMFRVFGRWSLLTLLVTLWSLVAQCPHCQADMTELVLREENIHRSSNYTSALYGARRRIMPGLNTLASASCAHAVPVRTQVRVVWTNTCDTSTRMRPDTGVTHAGKASPFARSITIIWQPIRVSNDMSVPYAWRNLHGRAVWKLTCCFPIMQKSHLSNLFVFIVDVKQTK